ncbi:DUF2490 domain-containing protein [Mucilaginibacter agri]|uniref:DUF2490 domain-containing protein n=1 Tax=Mucilaginibacter agri TaxID=2695265 RepID=A0A965ZIS8_9SPHI|nr:DUF2490 domain-containing protein [Mucilaginibacter agri]NCD70888.1 DUF2490 domain-containing protein [Mucilaginibacter agri]
MRVKLLMAFAAVTLAFTAQAQTKQEFSGWGAWFHTQKFSEHWGLAFDAQFRSADDWKYLKHPLIRPGVSYYFKKNKIATVGYLFTGTHRVTDTENTFRVEQRIWEQYIYTHKIQRTAVMHRFRLEQRFVDKQGPSDAFFAQRFRYFIRGVIPTQKTADFTKGTFVGLQNEVFVNVQNKDKTNNAFFDQNRAYAAFGYRFSRKLDLEAGYLNQYINGLTNNTMNHVAQIALYTRF